MVTNYAQQLTAGQVGREGTAAAIFNRAVWRFGQLLCGIRGHDSVLHFEAKRVMMRCTSCGYDTPGWDIAERTPRKRFDGDPGRHVISPGLGGRDSELGKRGG